MQFERAVGKIGKLENFKLEMKFPTKRSAMNKPEFENLFSNTKLSNLTIFPTSNESNLV